MKRTFAVGLVFLAIVHTTHLPALPASPQEPAAKTGATISTTERVMMASQIYHIVSTFFPSLSHEKFDASYRQYLDTILRSEDRRAFDLASMELIATLHDGHSWFYDHWIDQAWGQPIGVLAFPLQGKWTVVRSQLSSVHVGDVIAAIDGTPIDEFFDRNRRYISASSDRDAGLSFFDSPFIFPESFTLTFADGRKATIDRVRDQKSPTPPLVTEGRWLVEKSIAYIKVPTFHGIETQAQALGLFRQFHDAKTVILDVRGNPGTGAPGALQGALMTGPYHSWSQSSNEHGGALLRNYAAGFPGHSTVSFTENVITPRENVFAGRLILLTDRICSCACEDFVMPFKYSKRATLVGETTAGSFSMTRHVDYDNGMILNIAAVRHTFPDGSRFEGVGIAPDVAVDLTPEDLRSGRDPVLQRALELAQGR